VAGIGRRVILIGLVDYRLGIGAELEGDGGIGGSMFGLRVGGRNMCFAVEGEAVDTVGLGEVVADVAGIAVVPDRWVANIRLW